MSRLNDTNPPNHRYGDICPGGHGATGLAGIDLDDQLAPQEADARNWTVNEVAAYYEGIRRGREIAQGAHDLAAGAS